MNAELQSTDDTLITSQTNSKTKNMTVTVSQGTNGGFTITSTPDTVIFTGKHGPQTLICTLESMAGVPQDIWFEIPTYTPEQYLNDILGINSKKMTLIFGFRDKKVDGHLTFNIGGLPDGPHRFDPQVGNDPPPQADDC